MAGEFTPYPDYGAQLQNLLLQQRNQQRQDMLDALHQKDVESQISDRDMYRQVQKLDYESKISDRAAQEQAKRRGLFVTKPVGAVFDPGSDFEKTAQGVGFGDRFEDIPQTAPAAPGGTTAAPLDAEDVGAPSTPPAPAGPPKRRWLGTPEQAWSEDPKVNEALEKSDYTTARRLAVSHGVPVGDIQKLLQQQTIGRSIGTFADENGNLVATHYGPNGEVVRVPLAGLQKAQNVPQAILLRQDNAKRVDSHLPDIVNEIELAESNGLLGPAMGRWSAFLTGTLGSSGNQPIKDKNGNVIPGITSDSLLTNLGADLNALKSGFAMVHGGARGGASVQLAARWDKILSADKMSKEELLGALSGVHGWLSQYAKSPLEMEKEMQRNEAQWAAIANGPDGAIFSKAGWAAPAETPAGNTPPKGAEPAAPATPPPPPYATLDSSGRMIPATGGAPTSPPAAAPATPPIPMAPSHPPAAAPTIPAAAPATPPSVPPEAVNSPIADAVRQEATNQGVDPNLALAVALTESSLRPNAVSPKGAQGVMQLMPATAARHSVDPTDITQNIKGGVAELRQLLTQTNGDVAKTLALYNASPQAGPEVTAPYVEKVMNTMKQLSAGKPTQGLAVGTSRGATPSGRTGGQPIFRLGANGQLIPWGKK